MEGECSGAGEEQGWQDESSFAKDAAEKIGAHVSFGTGEDGARAPTVAVEIVVLFSVRCPWELKLWVRTI